MTSMTMFQLALFAIYPNKTPVATGSSSAGQQQQKKKSNKSKKAD